MPDRRRKISWGLILIGALLISSTFQIHAAFGKVPDGVDCFQPRQTAETDRLNDKADNTMERVEITVKRGDTLWAIAKFFNTSVAELVSLNGLKKPDLLQIGSKLWVIPGGDQFALSTRSTASTPSYSLVSMQRKEARINVSEEELELLARVIYAEARGENFEGQIAVGAVVLNRLKNPGFPKTIQEVIYQPGAFTAVDDRQIHLTPNDQAYQAALAALNGEDPSNGALYYYNPRLATDRWIKGRPVVRQIGNHTFSI